MNQKTSPMTGARPRTGAVPQHNIAVLSSEVHHTHSVRYLNLNENFGSCQKKTVTLSVSRPRIERGARGTEGSSTMRHRIVILTACPPIGVVQFFGSPMDKKERTPSLWPDPNRTGHLQEFFTLCGSAPGLYFLYLSSNMCGGILGQM
jgi:hypothetical protein